MPLTYQEKQAVAGSVLFRGIPLRTVEAILSEPSTVVRNYTAGWSISQDLYLSYFLSGYAVVSSQFTLPHYGKIGGILEKLGPGDLFGTAAVFQEEPSAYEVQTLSDARILRIAIPSFRRYAETSAPLLWRNLGQYQASSLKRQGELLEVLQTSSVDGRLIGLLLLFARGAGTDPGGLVDTKLSADRIADIIRCTPWYLSKKMTALRNSGFIAYHYAGGTLHYRIFDEAALVTRFPSMI